MPPYGLWILRGTGPTLEWKEEGRGLEPNAAPWELEGIELGFFRCNVGPALCLYWA